MWGLELSWPELPALFPPLRSYDLTLSSFPVFLHPSALQMLGKYFPIECKKALVFFFFFPLDTRSPLSSPGCPTWTLSTGYPWPQSFPALVLKVPGIRDLWGRWFKAVLSKNRLFFFRLSLKSRRPWILATLPLGQVPVSSFRLPRLPESRHPSSCHRTQDLDMSVLKSIWFLMLSKISLSLTFDR